MTVQDYDTVVKLKQKLNEAKHQLDADENLWELWSRSNGREVKLKGFTVNKGWIRSIYVPPKLIEKFLSENLVKSQSEYNALKRKFDNL